MAAVDRSLSCGFIYSIDFTTIFSALFRSSQDHTHFLSLVWRCWIHTISWYKERWEFLSFFSFSPPFLHFILSILTFDSFAFTDYVKRNFSIPVEWNFFISPGLFQVYSTLFYRLTQQVPDPKFVLERVMSLKPPLSSTLVHRLSAYFAFLSPPSMCAQLACSSWVSSA